MTLRQIFLYIALVTSGVACTWLSANTFLIDESQLDSMYLNNGKNLYNFDDLLASAEYKNAPFDQQQNMLEQAFHSKKFNAYVEQIKNTCSALGLSIHPLFLQHIFGVIS